MTKNHYHPAALAVAKGITIGFIGLTTPVDTHTGEASDPGLAVASPLKTLQNTLPAVAGSADVVILLSHCGYGEASGAADRHIAEGDVALAREAAKLTDKPVIILGGPHPHRAQQGRVGPPKPDRKRDHPPGPRTGKALGLFQAEVGQKDGKVELGQVQARLIPLKNRDNRKKAGDEGYTALEHDNDFNPAFERKYMTPILEKLNKRLDEVIAEVKAGPPVGKEANTADRYMAETALANFMNDAVVKMSRSFPNGQVDLALFNASGVNSGNSHQRADNLFRLVRGDALCRHHSGGRNDRTPDQGDAGQQRQAHRPPRGR